MIPWYLYKVLHCDLVQTSLLHNILAGHLHLIPPATLLQLCYQLDIGYILLYYLLLTFTSNVQQSKYFTNLLFQLFPVTRLLQLCSQIFLGFLLSHFLFSVMSPPHGRPYRLRWRSEKYLTADLSCSHATTSSLAFTLSIQGSVVMPFLLRESYPRLLLWRIPCN